MLHIMKENPDVYLIMIDLGFPRYDELKSHFPDRVLNTGASEQTALDIAVGLSYSKKIPFIYTISSFYWRGAETIRTYVDHEKLHIVMVGAGRNTDYSAHGDGYSHDARDLPDLFGIMKNFDQYYPRDAKELKKNLLFSILSKNPSFISVPR